MQTKKSLLFNEDIPWAKNESNEDFDVLMGCFNGADIWKLIGRKLYLKLSQPFENYWFWLFKGDGLGSFKTFMRSRNWKSKEKCHQSIYRLWT